MRTISSSSRAPSGPRPPRVPMFVLAMVAVVATAGCGLRLTRQPMHNFGETGPIFRGSVAAATTPTDTLRVTIYNIKFGTRVREAIEDLRPFASSDILLLQEVDYTGVVDVARTFGMGYVYAPASIHPDAPNGWFGNAILSRWPMRLPELHALPVQEIDGQRRMSISALVAVRTPSGVEEILACSVHTATVMIGIFGQRRQWRTLREAMDRRRCLLDVERLVVGGDFNSGIPGSGLYSDFWAPCFTDVTDPISRTADTFMPCCFNELDHIFARGFAVVDTPRVGRHEGSDHYPISSRLVLAPPEACSDAPCSGDPGG